MRGGVWVLTSVGLHGRRRGGAVATVLVLVIAAIGIAAGLVVSRQGAPLLDAAADDANVAHLVLYGDAEIIESVAADPEVDDWSGPFTTVGGVELPLDGETVPMQLAALDDPDIEVNSPPIKSGRWVTAPDEIVLDRSLAADLGFGLGDAFPVRLGEKAVTFTVVGTAVNFTDCFYPQCDPGRAWVSTDGLATLDGGEDLYAQAWLRFDDPAQADPFVERIAAAGTRGIDGTESWLDTRGDFLTLDRVFGSFVSAFGVFVLVVAAVVVAGSTAMRVVVRRREIGLLGAIGCTPRQVTSSLLLENIVVGVGAGVTGWFIAGFLAPSLQLGIGRTLGAQDPSWSLLGLVVTLATICLILTAATLLPAISAARRPVTDVLRDVPPERVSWLSRKASALPQRLSMLGLQDVFSQPTRSLLAALAVTVAVVGTLVSIGFVAGVDAVADDPATAGDPWDVVVIRGETPVDTVETTLADLDEVDTWFSEVSRRSTLDEGAFQSIATGGDPTEAGFEIAEGRAMQTQGEGIAGYGFLHRFGVAVGDEVEILAGTTPVTVDIVGMYRETEDSGEILRYRLETLEAVEPGIAAGVHRVRAVDGVDPETLAAALVDRLGPAIRTEILDTGVDDLAPLMAVLWLIAAVLLAIAGTNLLSTMLTSSRESAGRIGVQMAVGFTPRQVVAEGAMAGAGLGVVAAAFGVVIGLGVFRVLSDAVSSGLGVGPGWMPVPGIAPVVALVLLAVALSAGLGAFAVARVARRSPSDLLRAE